jgi:hypothetical protein
MNQPLPFAPLDLARAVTAAADALHGEVDPMTLLDHARAIAEIAPKLSARLQEKARRGFGLRYMLRKAAAGELATDVEG